jgi:hypothetical protein
MRALPVIENSEVQSWTLFSYFISRFSPAEDRPGWSGNT